MTVNEAKNLIRGRSGLHENDWDLFEAATVILDHHELTIRTAEGYSALRVSDENGKLLSEIKALEAKCDKAVELLRMSLHIGVGVQDYQLREAIESFLASIGGEEK